MAAITNPLMFAGVAGLATFLTVHHAPEYAVLGSTSFTFITTFIAVTSIFFIWSVVIYPKFLSPLRHLPLAPGAGFFMGHGMTLLRERTGNPARRWVNSVPNNGLIRYLHFFNRERVLLTSPKALSEVLVTKSYEFEKPSQSRKQLSQLLGNGLIVSEGEDHKQQRKNLQPAFKYHHVRELYPVFWEKAGAMVNAVAAGIKDGTVGTSSNSRGAVVDFGEWLTRCTLDIITTAGMGFDVDSIHNPHTELNTQYKTIFAPTNTRIARVFIVLAQFIPITILRNLPLKRNTQVRTASASIRSISRSFITSKQSKLSTDPSSTPKDILSIALDSGAFTVDNLVDQTMTFLAAGHETISTATVWALCELAGRPALQTQLRQEIHASLPSLASGIPMTADAMDRASPLLHAVCAETLRFHPPVPITRRFAVRDTTILDQPIPKNTAVFIVPWATNFDKAQWGEDAGEFRPERWLDGGGEGSGSGSGKVNSSGGAESNFSNLTFLHGPRSCIGMGFARAEFACLLAAVVGRFEFEMADPRFDIDAVQTAVVARPRAGCVLRLRAVEGW